MFYKLFLRVVLSFCLALPVFAEDFACTTCDRQTLESSTSNHSTIDARPRSEAYTFMIFGSLGMPAQSLKAWGEQAARLKVPLRIRGFYKDSLQKTTQKSFELFGENNLSGLLIDPESFEQYNIQAVPAVVLALAPAEGPQKMPALFEVVYGDTTLEAALELMMHKGSAEVRVIANRLLNQLKGTFR